MFTKQQVIHGLSWKGSSKVIQQGIQTSVKLALAYYLLPKHFGLIGMAAVFVALVSTYTDIGIGAALIQRKEEDLTPAHWHTAYWINLCVSWLGFVFVGLVMAPLAALYYKQTILTPLCIVISLSLLLEPLVFVHQTKLQKELQFKKLFIINTIGIICGGLFGFLMAINSFGVWSIAGQSVVSSIIRIPIIWGMEKWRPSLVFKKQAAKDLFVFGSYDVLARLVGYFNQHINVFIVSSLFAPAIVGYFVFANSLTVRILAPINDVFKKVFFPFFSNIQEDTERIKRYYLEQIKYSSLIVFPFLFGLILISKNAIDIFFAEKWQGAVQPVQLLSVFAIITVVGGTPGTVFKSIGAVKLNFKLSIVKYCIIRIPCVLLGGLSYGFIGYLFSLIVSQLIILIIDLSFLNKFIHLNIWNIIKSLQEVILSTCLMVITVLTLRNFFDPSRMYGLFLLIIFGATTFLLIPFIIMTKGRIFLKKVKIWKI